MPNSMHNAPYSRNMTGTDDKPSCFERQARLHTTARPRAAARATADAPANPRQKTSLTIRTSDAIRPPNDRATSGARCPQGSIAICHRLSPNAGVNRMMSDGLRTSGSAASQPANRLARLNSRAQPSSRQPPDRRHVVIRVRTRKSRRERATAAVL